MTENNGYEWYQPTTGVIRPTKWLWKDRIERGGLALIVGNEEVGKGFFAVWLMSKLTRGKLPGAFETHPLRCEIIAYEDSVSEWTKRMEASGARVGQWGMLRSDRIPDLTEDIDGLVRHWKKNGIKFVYFDQLQDHLGVKTDSYNNKEVRNALLPLQAKLVEANITGLATMHPNKRGENAREKVNGSIGTLAVVRSAFYMARHPDDDQVRVVVQIKNSRGPRAGGFEFEIVDTDRDFRPNGKYVKTGMIAHVRSTPLTIDDLLKVGRGSPRADVDRKLKTYLADGKWHWYSDIVSDCGLEDLNFNVVQRCSSRIGVEKDKKGYPARSRWRLPESKAKDSKLNESGLLDD